MLSILVTATDPPWPIDNCKRADQTCRDTIQRCDTVCHQKRCEIKVGVILTDNEKFLPNVNTVSYNAVIIYQFLSL